MTQPEDVSRASPDKPTQLGEMTKPGEVSRVSRQTDSDKPTQLGEMTKPGEVSMASPVN
jgi:hypothetical protein